MKIEEACRRAALAGWKFIGTEIIGVRETTSPNIILVWKGDQYSEDGVEITMVLPEQFLLDPLWWQALGKALGDGVTKMGYSSVSATINEHGMLLERWLWRWHCFIDHLANGGTPDSFFQSLN